MRAEIADYVHRGWYVLPIHGVMHGAGGVIRCTCGKPGCSSAGKHPTTTNGLKTATLRPDWIDAWWKKWPWANIGIATGALSGLVVVDIDPRHGGDDALDNLWVKHGKFDDTAEVLTGGGGRHFYFKHPGFDIRNSVCKLGAGIDVRGDGGYVLAPPSTHASGESYGWEASSEPDMVGIADMPKWLIELLAKPAVKDTKSHIGAAGESSMIGEGGRDNFLTRFAGSMRRYGTTYEGILAVLRIENEARCNPPLSDDDLRRIAKSSMRWAQTIGA